MTVDRKAADAIGAAFLGGACALMFLAQNPESLAAFNAWTSEWSRGRSIVVAEADAVRLALILSQGEECVP